MADPTGISASADPLPAPGRGVHGRRRRGARGPAHGRQGRRRTRPGTPERAAHHYRRPARWQGVDERDAADPSPVRGGGNRVLERIRHNAEMLSLARLDLHRPVCPQPRRDQQRQRPGAPRPDLAAPPRRGGIRDGAVRQVPELVAEPQAGRPRPVLRSLVAGLRPPPWEELARVRALPRRASHRFPPERRAKRPASMGHGPSHPIAAPPVRLSRPLPT